MATRRICGELDMMLVDMENNDFILLKDENDNIGALYRHGNRVSFLNNAAGYSGSEGGVRQWERENTSGYRFGKSWVYDNSLYEDSEYTVMDALELISRQGGQLVLRIVNDGCTTRITHTEIESREFILPDYTKNNIYTGQHGYHNSHEDGYYNEPKKAPKEGQWLIGVELEIEANDAHKKREINKAKSNWFFQERDGSLGTYGIELITIPMLPKDIKNPKTWAPLCEYLSPIAKSWETGRCGLHVHIGREILGDTEEKRSETIGKLLFLYHHYVKDERLNTTIYGRSEGYSEHDGKTDVSKAVMLLGGSSLLKDKDIRNKVDKSLKDRAGRDRYFDINLQNSHTIEFRKGKGSINVARITSIIEYCEKMVLYAKATSWTSISFEGFVKFLKAKVSKQSPLYRYIGGSIE